MKGIYVGALHDITPLLCLDEVKTWIYVDCMPKYDIANLGDALSIIQGKTLSFFEIIEYNFNLCGLQLQSHDKINHIMTFASSQYTVHYIYSTVFPKDLSSFHKSLLTGSSVIYHSGFNVSKTILEYCLYPCTIYLHKDNDYECFCPNDLLYSLTESENINLYLIMTKKYIAIDVNYRGTYKESAIDEYKKNLLVKCDNMKDLLKKQSHYDNIHW
jgi:hypothetical protein